MGVAPGGDLVQVAGRVRSEASPGAAVRVGLHAAEHHEGDVSGVAVLLVDDSQQEVRQMDDVRASAGPS